MKTEHIVVYITFQWIIITFPVDWPIWGGMLQLQTDPNGRQWEWVKIRYPQNEMVNTRNCQNLWSKIICLCFMDIKRTTNHFTGTLRASWMLRHAGAGDSASGGRRSQRLLGGVCLGLELQYRPIPPESDGQLLVGGGAIHCKGSLGLEPSSTAPLGLRGWPGRLSAPAQQWRAAPNFGAKCATSAEADGALAGAAAEGLE